MSVQTGIAAGHPATAEVGLEILAEGGTAADAAVAAAFASCVAETVMTGLAGGGHAIYYHRDSDRAALLDFFCAVPGLGSSSAPSPLDELHVLFGEEPIHYSVGIAACAVPGVPAGLAEIWHRYGRQPWDRLLQPALRLARSGVRLPPAHAKCLAMLAPVMTMREGKDIYSPGGNLLEAGQLLDQPGLARALELLAEEGAKSFYRGTIAEIMLDLVAERGGSVTQADLDAYRPIWLEPAEGRYAGLRICTRGGLAGVTEALERLPLLRGTTESERTLAFVAALDTPAHSTGTTNLSVVDHDGNACVVTTSLGLGSGDFLPGLDVHLNNMLGETDLLIAPLAPGERMASMMAPSVVLDEGGLVLAGGSAGGTRLRSALVQVFAAVFDEGLPAQDAVDRSRVHPDRPIVHLEPGFGEETLEALRAAGYEPRLWPELHHYFGGVSIISRCGAAADPRRSGLALTLS